MSNQAQELRQRIQTTLERAHEAKGSLAIPAVRRVVLDRLDKFLMDVLLLNLEDPGARDKLLVIAARIQAASTLYGQLLTDVQKETSAYDELRKLNTNGGQE